MSAHDSDSEKAPSHRSESPNQEQSEDGRLPECNPSNFNTNATTSSSRSAKKAQKKPKTAAAATSDGKCIVLQPVHPRETIVWLIFLDENDSDVQTPAARPNTDTRPGGGFLNPGSARPRERKMKWNDENDRQLLIYGLGRDISGSEYEAIANSFPEQPSAKAIQERLTKLRALCRQFLKQQGIYDPETDTSRRASGAVHSRSTGHAASSPPLDLPPKKKQTRQPASSAALLAQPPPPQGGASSLRGFQQTPPPPAPGLNLPPHMLQPSSLFSPVPTGRGRASTFPVGPHSAARMPNMQSLGPMGSQPAMSPHASTANMGVPQMGVGQFQPYAPWALSQNAPTYPGTGAGMGSNLFQYGQSQVPFGFTPEQLVLPSEFATLPASIPAGPTVNPTVPDAEELAEENAAADAEGEDEDAEGEDKDAEGEIEEENPLRRFERDLQAKRDQRDAVSAVQFEITSETLC
jgi:hypothetical protein